MVINLTQSHRRCNTFTSYGSNNACLVQLNTAFRVIEAGLAGKLRRVSAVKMNRKTFNRVYESLDDPEMIDICKGSKMGTLWTADILEDDSMLFGDFVCIGE